MSIFWRQKRSLEAQEQHQLGVSALEAGDVAEALLHLRAAVRLDANIQLRPETAEVYERGARLWYESAEVRDEIHRREGEAKASPIAAPNPASTADESKPACCSYKPGHVSHWIAVLRVYALTPRDPVTVVSADADGWITFRDHESKELRWWHHDGPRVVALVHAEARFWRVRDSRFLVAQRYPENAFAWLYCDVAPSRCVLEPSADPIEALENEGGFVMRLIPDPE